MAKQIITTRIDGEVLSGLKQIARQEDRSVSYLLRKAVEQFVSKSEEARLSIEKGRKVG